MGTQDVLWIRIKPFNPRKGYRLKRYMVFGTRFEEERGWYKISATVTATVADVKQQVDVRSFLSEIRNGGEDSKLAFDICTEAEAKAISLAERKAKEAEAQAPVSNPVDLTSAEVRRPSAAAPTAVPLAATLRMDSLASFSAASPEP